MQTKTIFVATEKGGKMMADCKWMQDEICVNDKCPMCCDFCPVADYEGVCRYEERGEDDEADRSI